MWSEHPDRSASGQFLSQIKAAIHALRQAAL
jgi:hypothetical protein